MDEVILKSGLDIDAYQIILKHGFTNLTPEISLLTSCIFEKNGKKYKFVGWHHLGRNKDWHDIIMKEVRL